MRENGKKFGGIWLAAAHRLCHLWLSFVWYNFTVIAPETAVHNLRKTSSFALIFFFQLRLSLSVSLLRTVMFYWISRIYWLFSVLCCENTFSDLTFSNSFRNAINDDTVGSFILVAFRLSKPKCSTNHKIYICDGLAFSFFIAFWATFIFSSPSSTSL